MHNAFVIMPYRPNYEQVFDVIKPLLEQHGFQAVRADQLPGSSRAHDKIEASIRNADLVVVEATENNPNVYFEWGIAVANQKEFLALATTTAQIPFDTRQWRHLLYDPSDLAKLQIDFETWLQATSACKRVKANLSTRRMERGDVFPELFNAAVHSDLYQVTFDNRILDEIQNGSILAFSHSYRTDIGAGYWLELCNDPLFSVFRDSLHLLTTKSDAILSALGNNFLESSPDFISLGPGNGQKDRVPLRQIARRRVNRTVVHTPFYYPVDISFRMLATAVRTVHDEPEIRDRTKIKAIAGDFQKLSAFRPVYDYRDSPNLFSFLGNTLGNTSREINLLQSFKAAMRSGDVLLIEVRLKKENLILQGHQASQFGLSFAPLGRLGVPYDSRKIAVRREDSVSQITGTDTLSVHYEHAIIGGNEYSDIFLSCVNFYDRESLIKVLTGKTLGFEILDVFHNESMALFVARKP